MTVNLLRIKIVILTTYNRGLILTGAIQSILAQDYHIVSPIQIYLDLMSFSGRGEEAAAAILEEVIRPQW